MSDNHGCCGHHHDEPEQSDQHDHTHTTFIGSVSSDEVAECPVMKGNVVIKADAEKAGLVRDYRGVRYYLCCAGCAPLFDANPQKYATAS